MVRTATAGSRSRKGEEDSDTPITAIAPRGMPCCGTATMDGTRLGVGLVLLPVLRSWPTDSGYEYT